jgi:Na+-transporting NADH:ubiquinone oxidoreductase subunit A
MKSIKLKKGLNIAIDGKAATEIVSLCQPETITIVPDDFLGFIPKLAVKEGEAVKAGSVLLFDKDHPELKIVSPMSGTVTEILRGERRKLLRVSVKRDTVIAYEKFPKINLASSREDILETVLSAGFGAFIKRRPYDVVINPTQVPKNIFVSAFDSAPLAPDYNFVLKGRVSDVQMGLSVLAKLTDGKVYYSVSPETSAELRHMLNVEVTEFIGAHPAGNVGVQINALHPVNKGEVVWTMNVQDVAALGAFANTGKVDLHKIIALVGPEVINPCYFRTFAGTPVSAITKCELSKGVKVRVVNGNVLTGIQADDNSFLNAFAGEVSAIAEGDNADELFGWISPRINKFSASWSYPWRFIKKHFDYDARLLGGRRALFVSGEYEKVFPMDIMPEQLLKAMIAKNLDKMEQLGAYEVAPEDFALCEFVCPSKIEIQKIVREALDYMRKELE